MYVTKVSEPLVDQSVCSCNVKLMNSSHMCIQYLSIGASAVIHPVAQFPTNAIEESCVSLTPP